MEDFFFQENYLGTLKNTEMKGNYLVVPKEGNVLKYL